MIHEGDVILFQGDSITDAGRQREQLEPNRTDGLGTGYAYLTAAALLQRLPGHALTIYNRGISGNKVWQLEERWAEDCLDLKPNVVSILIGVNDTWHGQQSRGEGVPLDVYEQTYRKLIETTRTSLPGVRFVLCEPFVLRCGAVTDAWFPEIDERRDIVRTIADDIAAVFVPFQQAFNDAVDGVGPQYWAADGVHPSIGGHMLLSQAWLRAVLGA